MWHALEYCSNGRHKMELAFLYMETDTKQSIRLKILLYTNIVHACAYVYYVYIVCNVYTHIHMHTCNM